ncbi:GNAT family N-acetyltransferase [Pseudoroseomonas globiformis]|uniref:GNAT family N-acetyltransferase n=1 Tax=Teichococcus globiformis TaxID=2307229 RepID=A0ABV7G4T2_9PROT
MDIELIRDMAGPEAQAIRDGLSRHRAAALRGLRADIMLTHPLCLFRRDEAGIVQAGLLAEVALDWLFIEKFWVDETLRGQGAGSALLTAAEAEAVRLGAVGAHLYTSSFQAPAFYRKHGYREMGRLEGRPAGHDRHWFAKRF